MEGGRWSDVCSGQTHAAEHGSLAVAALFAQAPVALLLAQPA